jgi:hypothetical protein
MQFRPLVCMLLVFAEGPFAASPIQGIDSHGTLGVFVPSATGLVVCLDKRAWNPISRASDDNTKIYCNRPCDCKCSISINDEY